MIYNKKEEDIRPSITHVDGKEQDGDEEQVATCHHYYSTMTHKGEVDQALS